jgi:cellulose synthase/poly-beta-1,6-N-acetylglucosamine synthase-like glycosyltransferase/peptidoglycan/xylan/chitin deacetylase (PgdA/CDA1 family)/spore germination protein YaaH
VSKPIFFDPTGKRWRRTRLALVAWTLVLGVLGFIFVQGLLQVPAFTIPLKLRPAAMELTPDPRPAVQATKAAQEPWRRYRRPADAARAPGPHARPDTIRAAFHAPWDRTSGRSLEQHADQLTHVCAEWMDLADADGSVHSEPDDACARLAAARDLSLILLLNNYAQDAWQPERVEAILRGPVERRERLLHDVLEQIEQSGARGVAIDFQGIDPACRTELVELMAYLRQALHPRGLELWLVVPVGLDLDAFDLQALAPQVDRFVAALHDENAEVDPPGPIASQPWFEGWLRTLMAYGEPQQWIVAVGVYGYDWGEGQSEATMISFTDALCRAGRAGVSGIQSQPPLYQPSFTYREDSRGHVVWFLDAVTAANQAQAALRAGAGGVALYRLGLEDPALWTLMRALHDGRLTTQEAGELHVLESEGVVAHVGQGEFLSASDDHADGRREVAPAGELLASRYVTLPRYRTLFHRGSNQPNLVSLTFDDGPDPDYTPALLDILKQHGVKATFFIVGRQAEQYPHLLQRIADEGHEIGNHTFFHPDLSRASDEEIRLELNATQRLIQAVTGRSTLLFRPPYITDTGPQDLAELRPLLVAQSLGYVTVAQEMNPRDYEGADAQTLLQRVQEQRARGNVVLMHDAGGDRSATVEALPQILDYLAQRGDRVAPLRDLVQISDLTLMPHVAVAHEGVVQFTVTSAGFGALHWLEKVFTWFLLAAAALVLLRTVGVSALAVAYRRRKPASPAPFDGDHAPPVSVLIAAYNEAKVIEGTLRSVLATQYRGEVEVVLVDDGSTDGTAEVVQSAFGRDGRVRLIVQRNRGKSEALSAAVAAARHDLLVFLDADTLLGPLTIGHLAAPFCDERVGAVSGHARVGNSRNFITRCQALEYACGFNIDRRAYAMLDAITVVPGAVSALRRQAVASVGGFSRDTLAEDTDLTLALHRRGWRVAYADDAVAWTEAPQTVRDLVRQRFRWAFGTMQCLWKHRSLLCPPRRSWLGWVVLPNVWFFQIALVAMTPLVDGLCLLQLALGGTSDLLAYFLLFVAADLLFAALALLIAREPLRRAWLILPMRFVYRLVLSWVIWKSLAACVRGILVGWGKLERSATAVAPT